METIELARPETGPTAAVPLAKTRALGVAIVFVLIGGVIGALTGQSTSSADVATDVDLALLSSANASVQSLSNFEMRMEFRVAGVDATVIMRVADEANGVMTFSLPNMSDVEMLIVDKVFYIPTPDRQRWVAVGLPADIASTESMGMLGGESGLGYLEGLAVPEAVEVLGDEIIDGVAVSHYRAQIKLKRLFELGQEVNGATDTIPDALLDGEPATMDIYLDSAGVPKRTTLEYEVGGIDFSFETTITHLTQPVLVPAPAEDLVESRQEAATLADATQLLGIHLAALVTGS